MVTRKGTRAALAATAAIGLLGATGAQAANLNLNDATPGEITVAHSGFELDGSTNGSPPLTGDTVTVAGESATFTGIWIGTNPGSASSAGVIYIVDPGQTDLVRARIDATWDNAPGARSHQNRAITVIVTSAPFGSDLGTLPAAFSGLGIPMPDGSIGITGSFRDPTTAAAVSIPSNLSIQYVGDLEPECGHPTLYAQGPDFASGANFSDRDPAGSDFEGAEDVQFTQDVVVRSLRWWGVYALTGTVQADADDFEMRVYEDNGGQPADDPVMIVPLPQAVRAGTGQTNLSPRPVFVYAADLPAPLAFEANTTYWFSIVNNTVNDADDNWAWQQTSSGMGGRYGRDLNPTGAWFVTNPESAFELCGSAATLDCVADFNGDGIVDGGDLAQLLAFWGPCPAPMPLMAPLERRDMLKDTSDDRSATSTTQ